MASLNDYIKKLQLIDTKDVTILQHTINEHFKDNDHYEEFSNLHEAETFAIKTLMPDGSPQGGLIDCLKFIFMTKDKQYTLSLCIPIDKFKSKDVHEVPLNTYII